MTDASPRQVASSSVETAPHSASSPEHQPSLMELHQQASSDLKQSSMEHDDNWDDFRGYMQVKRRKLHDQFQDIGAARQSSIFSGVTIYVNGWTQPDADELKRLMHAHGGNYEYNVYSGTQITHVIATNLPNAKVRTLGDTLVCTPQWIVDSITTGKQLPVHKYLLYSRDGAGQRRLNFERSLPKSGQLKDGTNASGSNVAALKQIAPPSEAVTFMELTSASSLTTSNEVVLGSAESRAELLPGQKIERPLEVSACKPSAPVPRAMPYKPTRGADFVNEFYTHSRLHYLSTWSSELKQFTSRMLPHVKPKYSKLPDTMSMRSLRHRAVVHVDLDCFFVSVSIRDKPHLKGKPVAVAHAKLPKRCGAEHVANATPGASPAANTVDAAKDTSRLLRVNHQTSEFCISNSSILSNSAHPPNRLLESMSDVASCSYEARRSGVCNGMHVGTALKHCPDLTIIPYEFDSYRQVSQKFFETLMQYSSVIEAVSCDEAYIELTDYVDSVEGVERIVQELRDEVQSKTDCTVSAGISHNMLLARMCTRVAKPNGQFCLSPDKVDDFLAPQQVRDLPGVGYSLTRRLQDVGLQTCGDIRQLTLAKLQSEFGTKTGQMLYDYTRGVDNRELKLITERKSLSADINFGIRFSDMSEAESLITNLAAEVEKRAEEANVVAGTITLKLKIRRQDAPLEAQKYLGHGSCDNTSRSCTLLQPTRTSSEIARIATKLLKQIKPVASDIRGVGIQLTKLVSCEPELQPGGRASSVHPLGADLRVLLKGKDEARTSKPPLPSLTIQPVKRGLYCAPRQGSSDQTHSTGATGSTTGATPSAYSEMDESFAVELPPASQLDSSVLEALPASLRERILDGYARKQQLIPPSSSDFSTLNAETPSLQPIATFNPTHPLPELRTIHPPRAVSIGTSEITWPCRELTFGLLNSKPKGILIGDEFKFFSEHRTYLKDWVTNFLDGPDDSDLQMVTVYLTDLVRGNLEATTVILKYFRRLILNLNLCQWYPVFNSLLQRLQTETHYQYGGMLSVKDIL